MTKSTFIPNLPHSPGVYLMRDHIGTIVYIGKARDLKKRVASYFSKSTQALTTKIQTLLQVIRHIDYVTTASEREALVVERRLIYRFQPTFNTMWKDDKSYPSVVLTMGEDFPRLHLTRKRSKGKGNIYFGPYPNAGRVRQLLRWAWRKKLFPLRPCKLDLTEKNPLPYEKVRSCLYLHTGECPAPCIGNISSREYKKIAKRAQWFFEGKKNRMISQWEKEMKRHSRSLDYEKAGNVRDRIETVRQMSEHVTVREMSEDTLKVRVGESQAVQDLMRQLKLKNPPERIECFDISHFQGVEKVASMVSFYHGRPDKSQYRKFIIRTVKGIDDFASIGEVVYRRYNRLKKEKKPLPDFILIDGGKGQLSSALKALKNLKIKGIPIAALAKREEEVFLLGSKKPSRITPNSKGHLLLQNIRDEAHRFAITFHRKRRDKRTLNGL